jgi:hypothetical protein
MIFLVNAVVVGSVNGIYVYYSGQALSPATHTGIQMGVATFTVGWNMAVLPLLAKPMKTMGGIVGIELILAVFNNIWIPCVVAAFTSPACFQVNFVLLFFNIFPHFEIILLDFMIITFKVEALITDAT